MSKGDTVWLVTGHYCATDANPFQDAEVEKTTSICITEHDSEMMLFWYVDGKIRRCVESPSEDSGGSTYLCSCSGVDTMRHQEWCSLLNIYQCEGEGTKEE